MKFRISCLLQFASVLIAIVLLPAKSSSAQDAVSAKVFLNSLFRLYDNGRGGVAYSNRYYNSSLLSLIRSNIKAVEVSGEGIPIAGTDVFCNCQEWDGIWVHTMDLKLETRQQAQAIVSFSIYAPKDRPKDDLRTYKYSLVWEQGQWRIYDIIYLYDPGSEQGQPISLRKGLQEDIDYYSHLAKP